MSAHANTCASAGTGNWQDTSKWTSCGSTYPQAGDTATIAAGHTITIPASESDTLGTAAGSSGVNVLTIAQNTGVLIINGSLHLDGDLMHQGTLTMGPDSVLEFSSDVARVWHSNTNFGGTSGNNNLLSTSGTSAAHPFTIRSTTGGTPVSVTINDSAANKFNMSYGTFLRVGSATLYAYKFAYGGGTAAAFQHTVTMDHITWDTCGRVVWQDAAPGGAGWALTDVHFVNSLHANPLQLNSTNGTSGTRTMDKCTFDNAPALKGNGAIYTRNFFRKGWTSVSGTSDWGQFGEATAGDGFGNFIRIQQSDSNGGPILGSFVGNYIFLDTPNAPANSGTAASATSSTNTGTLTVSGTPWTASTTVGTGFSADASTNAWMVVITGGTGVGQTRSILSNTTSTLTVLYPWATTPDATSTYSIVKHLGNPHVLKSDGILASTAALSYNVAENTGADNNGDLFSHGYVGTGTRTMDGNLLLPSASRDNPFCLLSPDNNATVTISLAHNTIWVGGQPAIMLNDGTNVPVGTFTSYKSNIAASDPNWTNVYGVAGASTTWVASAFGPYHIGDSVNAGSPASGTLDGVTPANISYNARYGNKAGFATNGYNIRLSTTPDTTGAVTSNPTFVSDTRNLRTWAVSRAYSVSTNPLTQISDGLTALAADASRVPDLISWVRAGFAPTNAAYNGTAHDGGTIGAVAFTAVAFPAAILQPITWQ